MSSTYVDPWEQFGSLDFDIKVPEDKPTWPSPGTANLDIVDQYEPLFTSATWTVVAKVNGKVIISSSPSDKAHSQAFIKQWARVTIKNEYSELRRLGVDADAEYVKYGGNIDDL